MSSRPEVVAALVEAAAPNADAGVELPKTTREGQRGTDREKPDALGISGEHGGLGSGISGNFFAEGEANGEDEPLDEESHDLGPPRRAAMTPEQEARRARAMRIVGGIVAVVGMAGVVALMGSRSRTPKPPFEPSLTPSLVTERSPPVVEPPPPPPPPTKPEPAASVAPSSRDGIRQRHDPDGEAVGDGRGR